MKRKLYDSPKVILYEETMERTFLSNVGGVEKMNDIDGWWDEDE